MLKVTLALSVILVAFVAELSCQKFIQPTYRPHVQKPRIILPTYRPPPRGKITRYVREVSDLTPELKEDANDLLSSHDQELQLNRPERSLDSPSAKRGGGHSTSSGTRDTGPTHPGYNRRNARSVDSPSARRGGGGPRTSSGSRNTGPTHPGYNRRNAREIRLPGHLNPLRPKPLYPRPTIPAPVPRIPILARTARDIQISGLPKKPTYRDVIIPNWNPNARTNAWNRIGGRHGRSLDFIEDGIESVAHERHTRDVQISGLPKKPTHRDVIIPNWNPNARTNPWNRIGGRHGRSIDFTEELIAKQPHEREVRGL
ncbi:uncharacterized protein [Choristoneura fumiferana]|uniref:uncharacterized protein n=1 Tax=Choristoneura fumiferana TaxID=7141 RepID=UPI003D15A275